MENEAPDSSEVIVNNFDKEKLVAEKSNSDRVFPPDPNFFGSTITTSFQGKQAEYSLRRETRQPTAGLKY